MTNQDDKRNLCKTCRFASFASADVPGSTSWQGRCLADVLTQEDSSKGVLKYHTIMQHFRCSNGKWQAR